VKASVVCLAALCLLQAQGELSVVSFDSGEFNASLPLGEWYDVSSATVNKNGAEVRLNRRTPRMDEATYRGRLNLRLGRLRKEHPEREIVLVAPADRAEVVREAGNVWAVRVVASEEEARWADALVAARGAPETAGGNGWRGRRVAFLGDSITDARHIGCTANYWNFLQRDLGLVPLVYGINGHQWNHVLGQAERLFAEHPNDVDEIVVFAGTNDYNSNVPLGAWTDGERSFRGRIAAVMDFLTKHYPDKTIWLMTPLHRGYATFGATNVQPDETYANAAGLWIDAYVDVVKEAAAKWGAARLIDANAESGLYPLLDAQARYFHNAKTDMLHPNTAGHERLAKAMARHFLTRDATALVRARLADLPPEGGTGRLTKDTYHFYEDAASAMWLDPSNNQSGEKKVSVPLVGRRNVTIDGGGSTFVFHGRTFPFAATNCTGLAFRNFTVTTRFPSCAGFVVTEKSDTGFTVKFDDGVCPYKVADGHLSFSLDGHDISTADGRLSLHALDRLVIIYLMTPAAPGNKSEFPAGFVGVVPEAAGERTVRFAYYGDKHAKSIRLPYKVGEKVVVNLEEKRYRDVFFFQDCDGVAVENVTMRRFGGMGVVGQRSGNIRLDRLAAIPPEGERVTLTADIVQFINCYGDVAVTNCEGGHSLDDWINIHGNYLLVESVAGDRVRLRTKHASHSGFFPYRPGDALEFVTAHGRKVVAKAKVRSVAANPADRTSCEVTVDADLGGANVVGLIVENATLNPNVTIRGNRFVDYPNLRLSGRGKYVIEGNRFERCCTAVTGMDLADYWYESGRISDMTIRNNAVVGGGGFVFGISGWRVNEPDLPKIHGRVLIEGNTFEAMRGAKWSGVGVRDFVVRQ